MANPLFQSITVPKSQVYSKITEILTTAGWVNVSSNPTTDFAVYQSSGESGDKKLQIQMRDARRDGTGTTFPTATTVGWTFSFRMMGTYTPGAPGVAGTFTRPTVGWRSFYIAGGSCPIDTEITLTYHCNKNRLILLAETPQALNLSPVVNFLGMPDTTFCNESGNSGLLYVGSSHEPSTNLNLGIFNEYPVDYPPATTEFAENLYWVLTPKNPNSAGKFHLSDILYGSNTIGWRGKLDGIFILPNTSLVHGDLVQVGLETYKVFLYTAGISSGAANGSDCLSTGGTGCVAVRVA